MSRARAVFGWILIVAGGVWASRAGYLLYSLSEFQSSSGAPDDFEIGFQPIEFMRRGFQVHLIVGIVILAAGLFLVSRRRTGGPVAVAREMRKQSKRDRKSAREDARVDRRVRRAVEADRKKRKEAEIQEAIDQAVAADREAKDGPPEP